MSHQQKKVLDCNEWPWKVLINSVDGNYSICLQNFELADQITNILVIFCILRNVIPVTLD